MPPRQREARGEEVPVVAVAPAPRLQVSPRFLSRRKGRKIQNAHAGEAAGGGGEAEDVGEDVDGVGAQEAGRHQPRG